MPAYHRGLTLVELLIVVSLLTLLVHLALPAFSSLISRERSVAALNALIGAVQLARASAVTGHRAVVLCPSRSTEPAAQCAQGNAWHLGALVFADANGNGQWDSSEELLRRVPGWSGEARITWRSFRNRGYLRFRGNGMTDWQNGSFTWCPANSDPEYAIQVVLNAGGRARAARDQDGDGIVEDSSGQPISC